jgi:hypothetical protein
MLFLFSFQVFGYYIYNGHMKTEWAGRLVGPAWRPLGRCLARLAGRLGRHHGLEMAYKACPTIYYFKIYVILSSRLCFVYNSVLTLVSASKFGYLNCKLLHVIVHICLFFIINIADLFMNYFVFTFIIHVSLLDFFVFF